MSTIAAGTTSTTALVSTGDTTGKLVLQTNGTTDAVTIDTSQRVIVGATSASAGGLLTLNRAPTAAFGSPMLQVGGASYTSGGYYSVGLGFTDATYTEPPAEIAYVPTSDSGGTKGSIVFGNRDVTTNTAVSERMRIDSSGNVRVGTTSTLSGFRLAMVGGGTFINDANKTVTGGGNIQMYTSDSQAADIGPSIGFGGYYIGTSSDTEWAQIAGRKENGTSGNYSGYLQFSTRANGGSTTERMRIDSSGNVGIGGTVDNHGGYARCLQVTGTEAALELESSSGYSYVAQNGTSLQIRNVANGNMPFYTNNTERMRIDSSGNVNIATTGDTAARLVINGEDNHVINTIRNGTGVSTHIAFRNGNGSVGTIQTSGTSTSYNTSSDYRLKENIAPMTGALATVAQLKPCTYTWKTDGSAGQGFIAHELQAVVPDCVSGEKDGIETYTDADGVEKTRPLYQGVDTSFLVATLTAAIQELKAITDAQAARIETLEAKVAALEAK